MTDPQALEDSLEKMADALIRDAASEDLETRVDVFKAVANWHVAIRRQTKPADDAGSFASMVKSLRGANA